MVLPMFRNTIAIVILATHAGAVPGSSMMGERISRWIEARRHELPFSLDPGISVSIVSGHGSRIDLVSGYGVQQVLPSAGEVPVSDRTLFEIGSLSKTMVALGLATLVDEGALAWDDPVAGVLGGSFYFGHEDYVRRKVSVRDLLSHRSGLAETQGDFISHLYPAEELAAGRLGGLKPQHELREVFDYSNTGWDLAGEVLRVASNTSSWCAAVHARVFEPLGMSDSYCDRNDVARASDKYVAGVHKASPCDGMQQPAPAFGRPPLQAPQLRSYAMVRTEASGSEAAGSVLSSARDFARVLSLLLSPGIDASIVPQIVRRGTLSEMLSAQMVVPRDWVSECGLPGGSTIAAHPEGHAFAAGLGFDVVGRLPGSGLLANLSGSSYAEKNGDTEMHKARMGILPEEGIAVVFFSNLAGSVGDSLTALKFGALALAAGDDESTADVFMHSSLDTSGYWINQFEPSATCTACGTVAESSGLCSPSHSVDPPLPLEAFVGSFGDDYHGAAALVVAVVAADSGNSRLSISIGPIEGLLEFGPNNTVVREPCATLPHTLGLEAWMVEGLAENPGTCVVAEFRIPPEAPAVGISARNSTIAYPWGCGGFSLPDAMPVLFLIADDGEAWAFLSTADVVFPRLSSRDKPPADSLLV